MHGERGATEAEVVASIEAGERFPARFGRTGFRRNFAFGAFWRRRRYSTKQIEAFAVQENWEWLCPRQVFLGGKGVLSMKLSYDPRYNIAYLRLREKTAEVEIIRISDEANFDLAPDGTVHGIEPVKRQRADARRRWWKASNRRRDRWAGADRTARGSGRALVTSLGPLCPSS